jgi:hypothetical protein
LIVARTALRSGPRVAFLYRGSGPNASSFVGFGMCELIGRLFNCRRCGRLRAVCADCDKGQAYCSDSCRQLVRQEQERRANVRYRRSPRGRKMAAARAMSFHKRKRRSQLQNLTHQPATQAKNKGNLAPDSRVSSLPSTVTAQEGPCHDHDIQPPPSPSSTTQGSGGKPVPRTSSLFPCARCLCCKRLIPWIDTRANARGRCLSQKLHVRRAQHRRPRQPTAKSSP